MEEDPRVKGEVTVQSGEGSPNKSGGPINPYIHDGSIFTASETL